MPVDRSSREWMQAMARLRTKAARLRGGVRPQCEDVLQTLDDALALADGVRGELATVQSRNTALQNEIDRYARETRELIGSLPHPIVQTDCAGQVLEANPAAAALLGLSQAKLKDELLLHFAEDRAAFATLVRELPRSQHAVQASARFRPRDRAPFQASLTVFRDPRSTDQRWVWCLDRVSAARTPARTPSPAAYAASRSEPCET
jgi:PAS domain-containing protein